MAETLSNGVVIPQKSEPISPAGVDEMRVLGSTADASIGAARFTKNSPGPFDFDTMKVPGTYSLGSPFPTGWTNVPPGISTASIFNVYGSPVQSWCAQEIVQFGSNPMRLWRISRTTGSWNPWIRMPMSSGSAMASNAAWQTRMVSDMGGPIDTGGKAAFALRLDHGYTNYKTLLRSGLLARGIVPGIATNSRLWAEAENSGATLTEVDAWVAAGEIEILNHSATHAGGLDESSLVDEIVNGRLELETQLPSAAPIWGFAPPGVTAGWDGFDGGALDGWDSPAGRIVLESHAYSLGYVGGSRRVLDGTIRQALSHITLDTYDLTLARAQVDAAIAEGRGIQMMLHPRELDKTGKITTADFLSLMDYIVAKRDAGDLVILSPDELVLADSTRGPAVPIELGTEHLDTVVTPGEYYQSQNGEATLALGYPVASGGRITVRANAGAGMVEQEFSQYHTTVPGRYWRKRYAGAWGPWFRVETATPQDLGTAHLDTVTAPGDYTQIFASRATRAQGYPFQTSGGSGVAGILSIKPWNVANGSVIATFTAWQTFGVATRTYYNGSWQAWRDPLGNAIP